MHMYIYMCECMRINVRVKKSFLNGTIHAQGSGSIFTDYSCMHPFATSR